MTLAEARRGRCIGRQRGLQLEPYTALKKVIDTLRSTPPVRYARRLSMISWSPSRRVMGHRVNFPPFDGWRQRSAGPLLTSGDP